MCIQIYLLRSNGTSLKVYLQEEKTEKAANINGAIRLHLKIYQNRTIQ
jgi:hypothetical protein